LPTQEGENVGNIEEHALMNALEDLADSANFDRSMGLIEA
jgi:hypothetical protein